MATEKYERGQTNIGAAIWIGYVQHISLVELRNTNFAFGLTRCLAESSVAKNADIPSDCGVYVVPPLVLSFL